MLLYWSDYVYVTTVFDLRWHCELDSLACKTIPCLLVHASVNSLTSFYAVWATGYSASLYRFDVVQAAFKPFSQLLTRLTSFQTVWLSF